MNVEIETSEGTFTVRLFDEQAPVTCENFLGYVRDGFYADTVFHRVIPGFVIQGGGLQEDMRAKPTRAPIRNEAHNGLSNRRGTLSMARTADPDSATSQFFVNLRDNAALDAGSRDAGYAVFAEVTSGLDVVDRIAATPTTRKGQHEDVPAKPVSILAMRASEDTSG